MTASGVMEDIPVDIDILIAGSSCVDFSSLNAYKKEMATASGLYRLYQKFTNGDNLLIDPNDPVVAEAIESLDELSDNLDKEGESTKTFVSILQYIRQHRPKIVILENVTKAPWDQIQGFWLPIIEYCAGVIQVDSKDFLVPQTRQRKYLFAVDVRCYGKAGLKIVGTWLKHMSAGNWFRHPPNLQNFLLSPSDAGVLQARFLLERTLATKPKKDVEAVVCRMDHLTARRNEGLGNTQPYTLLDERGNVQPRDESWMGYIAAITPRMQDLLDIAFLRAAKRGYDSTHKAMVLDLGQNVDRQNAKLGVLPCVLPSADLFLTDHGRPVLGIECLAVQGIPIDRISISVEKESQLKDMAGNAMTTTVAGAAILCAIIAERDFTRQARNQQINGLALATVHPEHLPSKADLSNLPFSVGTSSQEFHSYYNYHSNGNGNEENYSTSTHLDPSSAVQSITASGSKMAWQDAPIDALEGEDKTVVSFFTDLCLKGRRHCLCDAFRKHLHTGIYWRCKDCNEIRCQTCAGNPEHNFNKAEPITALYSVDKNVAYQLATVAFPARLLLDAIESEADLINGFDEVSGQHRAALRMGIRTCTARVHYYQTGLKFRDNITVKYESEKSYLTVTVTEESVTWSIYLRQTFFDQEIQADNSTSDAAQLLTALGYDLHKPLLRATIFDLKAPFMPTAGD